MIRAVAGLSFALAIGCSNAIDLGTTDSGDAHVDALVDTASDSAPIENVCSSSAPCSTGDCLDGLCSLACSSDATCGDGFYCDTTTYGDGHCHPTTVASCPSTACASSQTCLFGLCAIASTTICNPQETSSGTDGCDANSLCYDVTNPTQGTQGLCYGMPHCAPDGSCPVGMYGAICNQRLVPPKSRICIAGYCLIATDCPSGDTCVRMASVPVGSCSNRLSGSPCATGADCASNACNYATAYNPGICN